MRKSRIIAGIAGAALIAGGGGLGVANATGNDAQAVAGADSIVKGRLLPLNNSGASGKAWVDFDSRRDGDVHVKVKGLAPNLPHAQHIHFGQQALNECPTAVHAGKDHQLETAEGVPAYGPVKKSLTTSGGTSPASALAVDRFPTAPGGRFHYERDLRFGANLAEAVRDGKGIVVIHGVDYNGNGTYDFGSGKSDLDPALPAEATDPAVCGVLD